MSEAKPYDIPKQLVWEAYQRVKANRGAAGVDGVSLAAYEQNLKGNLYKVWNRMSSGSYHPPPVRLVEIPKDNGGKRPLGIPTVSDRVAQAVVKMVLEPLVEPRFHPDSYGYRPGRSALDAVGAARKRCWDTDWVIDLDIKTFFDSIPHDLVERDGRDGSSSGSSDGNAHPCTGWGASRGGTPICSSCGSSACGRRLECRSRMRRESHVRLCVQRRLACSAGERPAGVRVRSPVVWIAGWRETKTLKPIDNVSLGKTTSHRAVTTVNAKVASKVSSPEGRASDRCGSNTSAGWKRQHGDKDMPSNWRSPPRPGAKSPEQGRSYNRLNREVDRRREGDGWVRSSVEAG